jgi:cephalosporin hydroxylase
MSEPEEFIKKNKTEIEKQGADKELAAKSLDWLINSSEYGYSYHFSWLGRPIIQYPQDIIATQEIIWSVKPDLIIETGIAHGGSLVFLASILELLGNGGQVLGIDIDIREYNRVQIENHSLSHRISMIQGSSIDLKVVNQVFDFARDKHRIMVILDSMHTHSHVLEELRLYSPLVQEGSYLLVFDTIVEDMPADSFPNRPWGKGDNPKTAIYEFLKENSRFEINNHIDNKLLVSVAPSGYLKCIKD